MTHEAIVQITMTARNLGNAAIDEMKTGIDSVATKASEGASKIATAFRGLGPDITNAFSDSIETLLHGGSVQDAGLQLAEGLASPFAQAFGPMLLEKLAASGAVVAIGAALSTMGTALGGILAAAIPIGMAALPLLLVGALIAAVTVLIVNEDIRNRVISFATGLVGTLLNALGTLLGRLPAVIGAAFAAAWSFVINAVIPFIGQLVTLWFTLPFRLAGLGLQLVQTIINGMASLPGAVANVIASAFAGAIRSLSIDIGPFHIHGGAISVDLPHFASGISDFTGGLAVVGERGPELVNLPRGSDVIPNNRLTATSSTVAGVYLAGVSEDDILDMVDRGLYFRLQRSAPTVLRS